MVSEAGIPLCVGVQQVWDRCTIPTPVNPTPRGVTVRLHPVSGQEDFPGVDQWEASASPLDVCWSIH